MKIWFCRDEDGEVTVWDGDMDRPELLEGMWVGGYGDALCIHEGEGVFNEYGPGFHSVRKGGCKKFEIVLKEVKP